jgi:hypothetical protein
MTQQLNTVAIDLAKKVFHLVGADGVSANRLHGFGRFIWHNSGSIRAHAISPSRRRRMAR